MESSKGNSEEIMHFTKFISDTVPVSIYVRLCIDLVLSVAPAVRSMRIRSPTYASLIPLSFSSLAGR